MIIEIRGNDRKWLVIFRIGGVESVYGADTPDDIQDIIKWRLDQWIRLNQ